LQIKELINWPKLHWRTITKNLPENGGGQKHKIGLSWQYEQTKGSPARIGRVLDRIPVSGSFESAHLAQQASKLTDRIISLCSTWNEEVKTSGSEKENVVSVGAP